MDVLQQIEAYLDSQPEPKQSEMRQLHQRILQTVPGGRQWFFDGRNEEGRVVSNPTIGYGFYTIQYTNGTSRDFFQIGLSANQSGISVHVMGIEDKTYLAKTFGESIGKASVTGYCIKFRSLKHINLDVLEAAIRFGVENSNPQARATNEPGS